MYFYLLPIRYQDESHIASRPGNNFLLFGISLSSIPGNHHNEEFLLSIMLGLLSEILSILSYPTAIYQPSILPSFADNLLLYFPPVVFADLALNFF
jgi:hypothetical protein